MGLNSYVSTLFQKIMLLAVIMWILVVVAIYSNT
jgi:hypothetical protein